MTQRWQTAPMDLDYLTRLEEGCSLPDGDMITRRFTYTGGQEKDQVAIYMVELRGDDVLELIRLAKERAHQ